jgi:CRP-like cAMP-binding protein
MVERLRRHSPLEPDDQLAFYALPHALRACLPREALVRAGERPGQALFVVSGVAAREKIVGESLRQIVGLHFRGEPVDLHHALLARADHDVTALAPTEIAIVPGEALQALVAERPRVGLALWRDSLADAAIAREWTANIGRRGATTRVAHLICEIVVRLESAGLARREAFDLPVTQETLADCVGLTPVHVNRTLRLLERHGLSRAGKRRYSVTDWRALTEVADFKPDYLSVIGDQEPETKGQKPEVRGPEK